MNKYIMTLEISGKYEAEAPNKKTLIKELKKNFNNEVNQKEKKATLKIINIEKI